MFLALLLSPIPVISQQNPADQFSADTSEIPECTTSDKISRNSVTCLFVRNSSFMWLDPHGGRHFGERAGITLPFRKAFTFGVVDCTPDKGILFSYQLGGLEERWSPPSTNPKATYVNLDPGKYSLQVRATRNDDTSAFDEASISLTVTPPWWRTWWAAAVYIAGILLALAGVRRYEMNRINLKHALRMEHMEAEDLKQLDRMKSRFFANISHDFRTPLTLILGPLEQMMSTSTDERTIRQYRVMRRNARQLLRLINQLLDLSKLEAGSMKLAVSKGNLVAFVRGVVMSFLSLAERKDILLDVQAENEDIEIYFDRDIVEKIVVNLLANAFKFTPDHGEITVRLKKAEDPPCVEIVVRDTGIGIPADELNHIFDRFYQVDGSTTRGHEGTGIGLSLARDLVLLHKGDIHVVSEPSRGSEFIVCLPAGRGHYADHEVATTPVTTDNRLVVDIDSPESTFPINRLTDSDKPLLLVVEDNADVRSYIGEILSPFYRLVEAMNGTGGIEAAIEHNPDLIISDVMMPEKDGLELCAVLKKDERTSHIPIILLTARAAPENVVDGFDTGTDMYLTKPFNDKELLSRVRCLIAQRRRLKESFSKGIVLKPGEVSVSSIDDAFLKRAIDAVEGNIANENFSVEDLSRATGVSYPVLHRKLVALTGLSAGHFIRHIRLQRAKDLLEKKAGSVSEIAYMVGFGSPSYFARCFKKEFGVSPTETSKSILGTDDYS